MIPKQITNLIDLALRDGIMTLKEKQTIVAEAVAQGVDKDEITLEIDNRIRALLDTMPKENLRRCKSCGAQIPLISDDCLYCGMQLTQSKAAKPVNAGGNLSEAERIIIEENAITNSQNINIRNCPDCGAPSPILSNICPNCGHVLHENIDSEFNIRNLIDNTNQCLNELKNCKVSLPNALMHYSFIYAAELSFLFFTIVINNSSSTLNTLCGLLFVYAWVMYFVNVIKGKSPAAIADQNYFKVKSEYEKICRHTEAIYGNNSEARNALRILDEKFAEIDSQNLKNRRMVQIVTTILIAGILTTYFVENSNTNEYKKQLEGNPKIYELADKEKILKHGIYTSTGTFINQYDEMKEWKPYFTIGDNATLKIVPNEKTLITFVNDSTFTMKIQNLRLESTGKIYPGNPDNLVLTLLMFNKNGKRVQGFHGAIVDETFKCDSIHHQMPDSSRLDFKRLMKEGRYTYYCNFYNIYTYNSNQIDTLLNIMDEAESFVLVANKK